MRPLSFAAIAILSLSACASESPSPPVATTASELPTISYAEDRGFEIDERSYHLGMISGFGEFVRQGLKPLAVSSSFTTPDMDILFPDLEVVAQNNEVEIYRDSSPLQTDLFPFSRAEIVVLYTGDVLDRYLALKEHQGELMAQGQYVGEARRDVAVRFGYLMGYSDEAIENWLSESEEP